LNLILDRFAFILENGFADVDMKLPSDLLQFAAQHEARGASSLGIGKLLITSPHDRNKSCCSAEYLQNHCKIAQYCNKIVINCASAGAANVWLRWKRIWKLPFTFMGYQFFK
jgi:hypothetical protein